MGMACDDLHCGRGSLRIFRWGDLEAILLGTIGHSLSGYQIIRWFGYVVAALDYSPVATFLKLCS